MIEADDVAVQIDDVTPQVDEAGLDGLQARLHVAQCVQHLSLAIDNVLDAKPRRDPTWTSYPYYYIPWNNPTGRAFFLEANMKLGGSHSE